MTATVEDGHHTKPAPRPRAGESETGKVRMTNNNQSWVKRTPSTVAIVCGTVILVTALVSVTALAYAGRDTRDVIQLINLLLNFAGVILGGGAFLAAGAAARSAASAEDQVSNGHMRQSVRDALDDDRRDNPSGEVHTRGR